MRVGGQAQTRVSAYALCRDGRGRVLLVRIAAAEATDAGRWTLPGGGLEIGEQPQAGALRELAEETGLSGEITGVAGIDARTFPPNRERAVPMYAVRIVFHVRITGGRLRDERSGSTDRCAWFTLDEARAVPLVELGQRGLDLLVAG